MTDGDRPARAAKPRQVTPDGRYIAVRGRLWRRTDPNLPEDSRPFVVSDLMDARRAVGRAMRAGAMEALAPARGDVDAAKVGLGERGHVWWDDGTPDPNRRMARDTAYADCHAALEPAL